MKELRGAASAAVNAPIESVLALLEAVDAYPSWYPDVVRAVAVIERNADGSPKQVRTTLHFSQGPIARDFEMLMDVAVERPSAVRLTRVPHEPSDGERFEVVWNLEPGDNLTRIRLELLANLDVPRFLPVGGIGDSVSRGFVGAAASRLSA
jgi:hypothetical protein